MDKKSCDLVITVFKEKRECYHRLVDSIKKHTEFPYKIITTVGDGTCAENRNIGLSKTTADYICVIDDDLVVTDGWLTNLIETMEKYNCDAATCKMVDYATGNLLSAELISPSNKIWGVRQRFYKQPDDGRANYVLPRTLGGAGGFIVMKRDVYRKLEGYDERFKPNQYEDVDYFYRMWLEGFKVVYDGRVILFHENLQRAQQSNESSNATRDNWARLKFKWEAHESKGDIIEEG